MTESLIHFKILSLYMKHPFLKSTFSTISTKELLTQLLHFLNLYHHAKIQANSSIRSRDIVDVKILSIRPIIFISPFISSEFLSTCEKSH